MTKQAKLSPTEDLTLHKMHNLLVGKVVRVSDTGGPNQKGAVAICMAVHPPVDGSWDVEFVKGARYGFRPHTIDDTFVEGPVFSVGGFRRRFEPVNPQQQPWRFAITAGPSREELFDSLRLYREHRLVPFTLEGHLPIAVTVQSIEAEDGSGTSWNLILRDDAHQFGRLKAYFHTTNRTGVVIVAQ